MSDDRIVKVLAFVMHDERHGWNCDGVYGLHDFTDQAQRLLNGLRKNGIDLVRQNAENGDDRA